MIEINDILISNEILEEHFTCDLNQCKGACCIEGEEGAPVKKEEAKILKKILPKVKPYISKEGRDAIEKNGPFVINKDNEIKTPLIYNEGPCAYVVYENNIAKCGIEKAYEEGSVDFKKPISCYLYPIRESSFSGHTTINYDRWGICHKACSLGKKLKMPVFRFVKDALISRFGSDFYNTLDNIYEKHFKKK